MSHARLLALILAVIISGTVILFTASAMARKKPAKQSKSKPAPEQSAAAPAPEQPGGWIAEVKKSRPICASADDYVQIQRLTLRPSHAAVRKGIEFVRRNCPIAKFEPGDHVNVERTETFSIDKTKSITLACVAIKDGPCAWTDASQLVRIPEEELEKRQQEAERRSQEAKQAAAAAETKRQEAERRKSINRVREAYALYRLVRHCNETRRGYAAQYVNTYELKRATESI